MIAQKLRQNALQIRREGEMVGSRYDVAIYVEGVGFAAEYDAEDVCLAHLTDVGDELSCLSYGYWQDPRREGIQGADIPGADYGSGSYC